MFLSNKSPILWLIDFRSNEKTRKHWTCIGIHILLLDFKEMQGKAVFHCVAFASRYALSTSFCVQPAFLLDWVIYCNPYLVFFVRTWQHGPGCWLFHAMTKVVRVLDFLKGGSISQYYRGRHPRYVMFEIKSYWRVSFPRERTILIVCCLFFCLPLY